MDGGLIMVVSGEFAGTADSIKMRQFRKLVGLPMNKLGVD